MQTRRKIRFAAEYFWPGFEPDSLALRFPVLSRKYELVHDQTRPDVLFYSVFDGGSMDRMPDPPARGVPAIFMTAECASPDMARCDYAISFRRDIDSDRHIRMPNWVHRLARFGLPASGLLSDRRQLSPPGEKFCLYLYRRRVAVREQCFTALARRAAVDAPGLSMNNMPHLGGGIFEKLRLQENYRFSVAFEHLESPGYTTEKLVESFLAGSVPIYWGDPLVHLDFNPAAFLNLADYPSMDDLAEAVMKLEVDRPAWQRKRDLPVYLNDKIPECADQERIFAFFERIFR